LCECFRRRFGCEARQIWIQAPVVPRVCPGTNHLAFPKTLHL
jgi:hypothetical protein